MDYCIIIYDDGTFGNRQENTPKGNKEELTEIYFNT